MRLATMNNNLIPSFFEDLFLENKLDLPNYENFSNPKVNIIENDSNFVIELAAPGLNKENFEVSVEDMSLTITYKTQDKVSQNQEIDKDSIKFTRKEFDFTKFSRSFKLSKNIDLKNINASYTDGILKVELIKKKQEEIKRMVEIS